MTGKIFLDYLIELEDKHVLSYEELRSEVANLTVAVRCLKLYNS